MDGDRAVRVRPGWCESRRSGRRHPAASCSGTRPTSGKHRGSAAARDRTSRGALVRGSGDACHGRRDRGRCTAGPGDRRVDRRDHGHQRRPADPLRRTAAARSGRSGAHVRERVLLGRGRPRRLPGPVLAGVGVAWQGPGLVFVLASVAAVASALLCVHLRLSPRAQPVEHGSEGWRAAFAGLRALHRDWGSLSLLLVLANGFVLAGALDVLGVALADQVLHGGASSAGLVVGAMGVGGLVGAGLATSLSHRRRLAPALVAAGLIQGLAFALVAVLGTLAAVMLAIAVSGASGALLMVLGRTLLQRATDDQVLARVFAVQEGTTLLGLAIGALTVPALIDWLSPAGPSPPWESWRLSSRRPAGSSSEGSMLEPSISPPSAPCSSRTPFLAVLPGYELERLAQRASWLDVSSRHRGRPTGRAGRPVLRGRRGRVRRDRRRSWPARSASRRGQLR